jgi:hypothetical protein
VLHSTDGGVTWVSAGSVGGSMLTGEGGDVFVGSTNAVSLTPDTGQTWQLLPPAPALSAMWASPAHILGAGPGGAIVRRKR